MNLCVCFTDKEFYQTLNFTKGKVLKCYFLRYICHGRKSNLRLVEFQILLVQSPIVLSTKINLVETPIGLSTGRNSNQGDLGTALGSEI